MRTFVGILFVLLSLVTKCRGEEDVLMNYVRTDSSWHWVTMYRVGPGSGWRRESSPVSYVTCDFISTKTNSTNSWLISDFIPLKDAKTVTLSITFTARKCNYNIFPFCKQSIGIYSNENDVSKVGGVTMETILAGNFTLVGNASAEKVWSSGETPQDNVVNVTFPVKSYGIYVGFRDTGACVAMTGVRMTSQYCPQTVSGGAVFNKTGVALPGHDNEVRGECFGMSENLANGSALFLRCLSNGSWSYNLHVTCQCKVGYQPGQQTCQACPSGLYKPSTGNTMCIVCLENTHSNIARSECVCDSGYYRETTDPPTGKCTGPPSSPRDLNSTLIGQRDILLSWKRPLNDGGRNDLLYSISCFTCRYSNVTANATCEEPCDAKIKYTPSANDVPFTHVIIGGLAPGSLYSFKVMSKNGVSGLGANNTERYKDIRSYIPEPDIPNILVTFFGYDMVVLSLSGLYNEKLLASFVYSLSCALCDRKASDCVTCHESCGNAMEYHPRKGFVDKEFTVVSGLMEGTRYKFTLSVTGRDNAHRSNASVACVTTRRKSTGNPDEPGSSDNQRNVITLYTKMAFGLSAGLFLCAVILLIASVCLRKKWFNTAMNSKEGEIQPTLNNRVKPQDNIVYMEEIVLNNNATSHSSLNGSVKLHR